MGILKKLKHFIPIKTKILIYNSLVLSHLNFEILAWGFQCARLTKLQKKIIRILSRSKYNAHTEPIFKELKLLKLEDKLKLQELKLFQQPKTNHVYAKYCVNFDVPSVINSSPKAILDKIDTQSSRFY